MILFSNRYFFCSKLDQNIQEIFNKNKNVMYPSLINPKYFYATSPSILHQNKTMNLFFVSVEQDLQRARSLLFYNYRCPSFVKFNNITYENYHFTKNKVDRAIKNKHRYICYSKNDQGNYYAIGTLHFWPNAMGEKIVSCSYSVLPHYHHQGWNKKIIQTALEYMTKIYGEEYLVCLYVQYNNFSVIKMLEQCGFRRISCCHINNKKNIIYIKKLK